MHSVCLFRRLWIALGGSYQSCPFRILNADQPITASIAFSAIVDEIVEPDVSGIFEASNDLINWFRASPEGVDIPPGVSALPLSDGSAKFYRLVIINSNVEGAAVGVISATVDNATVGEDWMVASEKADARSCGCHG